MWARPRSAQRSSPRTRSSPTEGNHQGGSRCGGTDSSGAEDRGRGAAMPRVVIDGAQFLRCVHRQRCRASSERGDQLVFQGRLRHVVLPSDACVVACAISPTSGRAGESAAVRRSVGRDEPLVPFPCVPSAVVSKAAPVPSTSRRSRPRARDVVLFTVPTEQPMTSATSASLRSSKYRSTRATRCRGGRSPSTPSRSVLVSTRPRTCTAASSWYASRSPVASGPSSERRRLRRFPSSNARWMSTVRAVRDGLLHLLDPGPSAGDLEQTFLNQVFRLCEVPGDQVGRPQQGIGRLGDEAVKLNPMLALTPTSVHHLLQPFCVLERLPPIPVKPEKSPALTCR